MKFNKIAMIKIFLLMVISVFSLNVLGAGSALPSKTAFGGPPIDVGAALGLTGSNNFSDNISASIAHVVGAITDESKKFKDGLDPMPKTLLASLSIIALAWAGMQLAMTSGSLSEPMNKLITTIFTIGFATWLISSGYDTFVTNGIDSLMTDLVNHTSGGSTIDKMLQTFIGSEFDQIGKVIDSLKHWSIYDLVFSGGVTLLLLIVLVLGMLVTSLVGMVAVLTALILVAIAMALGPIFIPFLVLEKTSFLFDGWVKFLINACLTKVIVALLLSLGMAALGAATNGVAGGPVSGGNMLGSLLAAVAVSGVIGSLMLTAPGIAGMITSGGAMSQDGFAGRMHSAAKTMGRNSSVLSSRAAGDKMANSNGGKGAIAAIGRGLQRAKTQGNV